MNRRTEGSKWSSWALRRKEIPKLYTSRHLRGHMREEKCEPTKRIKVVTEGAYESGAEHA